jgi:hypothetical protein
MMRIFISLSRRQITALRGGGNAWRVGLIRPEHWPPADMLLRRRHTVRLKTILLATLLAAVGAGCHTEQPTDNGMANNLRVVAEGKNQDLVFKADKPGTIIVNNFSQGGNLYTGHLAAGNEFRLLPNADHAMIGKNAVHLDYDTNPLDTYRLYFVND